MSVKKLTLIKLLKQLINSESKCRIKHLERLAKYINTTICKDKNGTFRCTSPHHLKTKEKSCCEDYWCRTAEDSMIHSNIDISKYKIRTKGLMFLGKNGCTVPVQYRETCTVFYWCGACDKGKMREKLDKLRDKHQLSKDIIYHVKQLIDILKKDIKE